MKTALQELKQDLQESINGLPDALKDINDLFVRKTITDAVLIAYNGVLEIIDSELLGKEKQQIISLCTEAYESGLGHKEYSEQEIYNETFKQE